MKKEQLYMSHKLMVMSVKAYPAVAKLRRSLLLEDYYFHSLVGPFSLSSPK